MRRKNTRNATKSQEKSKPPEQAARKSRRILKRRRRSTSSDTEKSEEEQETRVLVESEEAARSDNEPNALKLEGRAEKGTPPPPTERKAGRGDARKSLSDGDNVKEEEEAEEGVASRRLRRRGGEAPKREDSEEEDEEGRTEKGKSKGKNRSKVEHEPTDASGTFTESEICTNAQVTPQSPQTDINNAVTCESLVTQCAVDNVDDNRAPEENNERCMSIDDDNDKSLDVVDSSTGENAKIDSVVDKTESDGRDEVIPEETPAVESEDSVKFSDKCDISNIGECKTEEQTTDSPKVSETNKASSDTSPTEAVCEIETKPTEEQISNTSEGQDDNCRQIERETQKEKVKGENKRQIDTGEISLTEIEKSTENKTSTRIEVPTYVDTETINKEAEKEQETQEEPSKLRRPEDRKVPERKTSMQKIRIVREPTEANEARCKRRWGGGLKLISPDTVDTGVMRNVYPNVQFLQESDVKLEYTEPKIRRYSTAESSDDKSDRRMSLDFDRQTSEDSVRNDTEQEEKANIIAVNRKISIIDDSATSLKPPPSPAKNSVSDVLFITNLVRPFTLKQLRELLERTGKIKENGFWTDRIKSKCYVQYETEEEARATREALHGVHWPIGNGKKLIIDYGTEEDLANAKNPPAPPPPAPPVPEPSKSDKENEDLHRTKKEERKSKEREEKETRRREHVREWDVGKEDLHRSKSKSGHEHEKRRHSRRSPSPTNDYLSKKKKKIEDQVPQKLMDDLFQKTKATPSIYWQPLTPEEIATKQQQRLERMAEHKKRMEETTRGRAEYGRGAPYRRKYD